MSTTLYDYYTKLGKPLPSVQDRAGVASSAGIQNYSGTADQNTQLLSYLSKNGSGTTPAVAPTTKPTIADTYKAVTIGGPSDTTKALTTQATTQNTTANNVVDESAIRNATLARYQAQIDALNQVYAQKYAEADKSAQGRQGSGRAIDARSGLLGSDFAEQHNAEIDKGNAAIRSTIDAEKNNAIQGIYGRAGTESQAEIDRLRKEKTDAADKYLSTLGTATASKQTDLSNLAKALLAQGVTSLKDISPADVQKIKDQYGIDDNTLTALITDAYTTKTTTEDKAKKDSLVTVADGTAVIDPKTGKVVYENTKNFAPKAATGSGSGSGVYGSGSGKFGNDLDAMITNVSAGITAKNQREAFNQAIGKSRNDQDKIATIAKVLNITGPAREDLTQTQVGQNNLRQAIQLVQNGTKTGLFTSGKDYLFNLSGNQIDPNLTQLKSYIVAAIQPYRNSVTGAAWGSQEEAEYQSLFCSVKDTPDTLMTKLSTLDKIMTNKRVGIIQSYADPLGANSSFNSYYSNVPANNTTGGAPVDATTAGLRSKYQY